MTWWQKPLWALIKLVGLRWWFAGDAPEPTRDDWRNPFWRLTERLKVNVEWHCSLIRLNLGFKRNGKWMSSLSFLGPVNQNFWNGILTFQLYVIKTTLWHRIPVIFPRIGFVIRPLRDWWFEAGIGFLFDKGQFAVKCTIMNWWNEEKHNPGVNAWDHEEGAV